MIDDGSYGGLRPGPWPVHISGGWVNTGNPLGGGLPASPTNPNFQGSGGSGTPSNQDTLTKLRNTVQDLLNTLLSNPFVHNSPAENLIKDLLGAELDKLNSLDEGELNDLISTLTTITTLVDTIQALGLTSTDAIALLIYGASGFSIDYGTCLLLAGLGTGFTEEALAIAGIIIFSYYISNALQWPLTVLQVYIANLIDSFVNSLSNLDAQIQAEVKKALWFLYDPYNKLQHI